MPRKTLPVTPPKVTESPRKTPQCMKCKRPRAGHPRSGCPFVDSPDTPTSSPTAPARLHSSSPASPKRVIGWAKPRTSVVPADDKEEIKRRRDMEFTQQLLKADTLASLRTSDHEIIDTLVQPGIMKEDSEDLRARVARWCDGAASSPRKDVARESLRPQIKAEKPMSSVREVTTKVGSGRSVNAERQTLEDELDAMARSAPAVGYVLDTKNLAKMKEKACSLGYHTRTFVLPVQPSNQDPTGVLVIGKDSDAVEALFQAAKAKTKSSSDLKKWSAGFVVGAVATFTGLAFS